MSCGGGYGNFVEIEHNLNGKKVVTRYAHLESVESAVTKGATVKKGQVIGKMGDTGHSFGKHLHYEVRTGTGLWGKGGTVDPFTSIKPTPSTSNRGGAAVPYQ